MKASIDFDDTLSKVSVQKLVLKLLASDVDVHIVTSRLEKVPNRPNCNQDLYIVSNLLNIPESNIHFTNMAPKWYFFKDNEGFTFHLDDDTEEVEEINQHTDTEGILFVETFNDTVINNVIERYL